MCDFGEVTHILETAADSDIGYFLAGFCQQLCSLLNPVGFEILDGGGADGGTETAKAFACADGSAGGDGRSVQIAGKLAVDTGKHGFDPSGITELFAADAGFRGREVTVKQENQMRQFSPNKERKAGTFPDTMLPGGLNGFQCLLLP